MANKKMAKKKIIVLAALLYILSAGGSYVFFSTGGPIKVSTNLLKTSYKAPSQESVVIDENAPKTEKCPINGELLTKGHKKLWEGRRPLLVMVENHTEARPQSGLTSADVIYEAVAEGGITRFLTVFYCKDTDGLVGPVRSARIYFVELATSYGDKPLYAHVGGANCNKSTGSGCANGAPADALGKIRKLKWKGYNDLDHVSFPVMFRDYERLSSVTEHTVYSSTQKLWEYANKQRGLTNKNEDGDLWDEKFKPWKFKEGEPSDENISNIVVTFWEDYNDYTVMWEYNPQSNSYKRSNGKTPHTDLNNDKQIEVKNVAVAFMRESVAKDGYDNGQHLLYKTTGQGESIVFQDGKAVEGVWRRRNEDTLLRFYDKSGSEIEFVGGQIFIEIVPEGNEVDYSKGESTSDSGSDDST